MKKAMVVLVILAMATAAQAADDYGWSQVERNMRAFEQQQQAERMHREEMRAEQERHNEMMEEMREMRQQQEDQAFRDRLNDIVNQPSPFDK